MLTAADDIGRFSTLVRVTMATPRRKPGPPPVIETMTGIGYRP
jgi:DNA-binding response OmpR family regulator